MALRVEITTSRTFSSFTRTPGWQGTSARGLSAFETRRHAPGGFVAEYVGGIKVRKSHIRAAVDGHE